MSSVGQIYHKYTFGFIFVFYDLPRSLQQSLVRKFKRTACWLQVLCSSNVQGFLHLLPPPPPPILCFFIYLHILNFTFSKIFTVPVYGVSPDISQMDFLGTRSVLLKKDKKGISLFSYFLIRKASTNIQMVPAISLTQVCQITKSIHWPVPSFPLHWWNCPTLMKLSYLPFMVCVLYVWEGKYLK